MAPRAGPWDYGHNRCEVNRCGFTSESSAVEAGSEYYYNPHGCGWTVTDPAHWGTPNNQTSGSCGSSQHYPKFAWGVEYINTRPYSIERYITPSNSPACSHALVDGFWIYRRRTVACPPWHTWDGFRCHLAGPNLDKNNECSIGGDNTHPIHARIGNSLWPAADVTGSGLYPLRFQRFYSSSDFWEKAGLGEHWRHTYARRVSLVESTHVTTVTVLRPKGNRTYFNLDSGSWVSDPDITARLDRLSDANGNPTGWRYTDKNDVTEEYDNEGRLIKLTDRSGHERSLEYDIYTRLNRVSDGFGHELTFSYDAENRIETVTAPDGGQYRYDYDGTGNLISITYPDDTPGDDTDNPVQQYLYENAGFPHALTGILDENGNRTATWTYDGAGRATTSKHADATDNVSLVYNANGTTTVSDALGKQTLFHFQLIHGVYKVSLEERQATATEPAASRLYTYDANGFLQSKTDWNGHLTTYRPPDLVRSHCNNPIAANPA